MFPAWGTPANRSKEVNMAELEDGCVRPARGPLVPQQTDPAAPGSGAPEPKEVSRMLAAVGKEAPDFEATAFVPGVGFKPIKLSDYRGKWIVLCFYPGDFTFV